MKVLQKQNINIPNYVTLIRIILIPILWWCALYKYQILFLVLFILAGISDFLDGFLARKLHQTSNLGTFLDSFSDNIIYFSFPFWFYIVFTDFFIIHRFIILLSHIMMILSLLFGFIKYKKLIQYHLYLAKLLMVVVYIFFIDALIFGINIYFFYFFMYLIIIETLEEILITFTTKKMISNRGTIFR